MTSHYSPIVPLVVIFNIITSPDEQYDVCGATANWAAWRQHHAAASNTPPRRVADVCAAMSAERPVTRRIHLVM